MIGKLRTVWDMFKEIHELHNSLHLLKKKRKKEFHSRNSDKDIKEALNVYTRTHSLKLNHMPLDL